MKILLIGDYSNYHVCLGEALRRSGHYVVVASDGSRWLDTRRDIDLSRRLPGKLGGMMLYMRLHSMRQLSGYDVVSLISPTFVRLRPNRLKTFFDKLKSHNGSVFLTAAGTDKAFMDMVLSDDCPLKYSEYFNSDGTLLRKNIEVLDHDKEWQQGALGDYCEYVYDNVDGVTTALYEYHVAMQRKISDDRLAYTGIPIDTSSVMPLDRELAADGMVNIFLGRHRDRQGIKGTDRLGDVAAQILSDYHDKCTLTIVENIPYAQYVEKMRQGDLVLDQLYSYTPATNALLAMAIGQAVVSGAESEYYQFIGETVDYPIFNAEPDDSKLYDLLVDLVNHPELVRNAGKLSRAFVKRHNDAGVVAQKCVDFWSKFL